MQYEDLPSPQLAESARVLLRGSSGTSASWVWHGRLRVVRPAWLGWTFTPRNAVDLVMGVSAGGPARCWLLACCSRVLENSPIRVIG